MELIKKIYLHMTDKSKDREITQGKFVKAISAAIVQFGGLWDAMQDYHVCCFAGEFMRSAQNFTQVTPLEVMILYQLTDLMHKNG